jgi:hypothetical protein
VSPVPEELKPPLVPFPLEHPSKTTETATPRAVQRFVVVRVVIAMSSERVVTRATSSVRSQPEVIRQVDMPAETRQGSSFARVGSVKGVHTDKVRRG